MTKSSFGLILMNFDLDPCEQVIAIFVNSEGAEAINMEKSFRRKQ